MSVFERGRSSPVLFLSLKWFVKSSDKQLSEKSVIVTGFSTYSPTNPVLLCCCSSLGKVLNHHPLLDSWHLHLLLSSLEVGGVTRENACSSPLHISWHLTYSFLAAVNSLNSRICLFILGQSCLILLF